MAKKYLKPGMKLQHNPGYSIIGLSASLADITVNWISVEEFCVGIIGQISLEDYSYDVKRDPMNGKLFYDDECGY